MKIEVTEDEAQKLIASQRREIATLKGRLARIAKSVDSLKSYKASLPPEFLKAASDMCGFGGFGENVNEAWVEEMHEFYVDYAKKIAGPQGWREREIPVFSEEFLFAVFRDTQLYKMSNILYNLKEIATIAGDAEEVV